LLRTLSPRNRELCFAVQKKSIPSSALRKVCVILFFIAITEFSKPVLVVFFAEHFETYIVTMGDVTNNPPASLQKSKDETKVTYTKLGNSGLRVSIPILGAM